MCGRFTFFLENDNTNEFIEEMGIEDPSFVLPTKYHNYNVAPTHIQPVVVRNSPNHLEEMGWGFSFTDQTGKKKEVINARGATLGDKRMFAKSARERRCIVPANGFYEWNIKDGSKQPFFIHPTKTKFFAFAGIWREETQDDGTKKQVFAIVTTDPNKKMSKLHNRMPVILDEKGKERWLNKEITAIEDLMELFLPTPESWIEMYPVSKEVNSVRNNKKELLLKES